MRTGIAALLFSFVAAAALAQPKTDDQFLNELYAVHEFREVAISPDGKKVAWAERNAGITAANADGSDKHAVAPGDAQALAWSPDSRTLAYLAGKDQKQLYAGTEKLTNAKGFLAEPQWSPDGKSIAFLFIANAKRDAGPLVAMSRAVGVINETIEKQRIAVVDVATKELHVVTHGDHYVYHFGWAPDSRQIVAETAPGSGDNNYWIAKLQVVDIAHETMRPLYTPKLQIAQPRWSPDGKSIAFIEGLMSDEGSTGGDLMLVDVASGEARNLTPDMHATVTTISGWNDATHLTFGEIVSADAAIARIDVTSGAVETLWREASMITTQYLVGASLANDGATSAVIRSSFVHPPEVWAGKIGAWKKITDVNAKTHATWQDAKSLHWKSDDFEVQGWLLAPAHVDAGKKYPIVAWVHGGPASAFTNHWPDERMALLAMKGYYVLLPNPRGSYGNGERFTQANVKDFGYGDLRDIIGGVDAAARESTADPERAGIWGWSYGGFMTMFAVTQTSRFIAAVAGAGISDWQSYYGENDIDQWMIPYFGASVYDDPAVYAKSSAITYIKNAHTPTLILVGERDGECPAPQSFEMWHALKSLGVPTELVVYADEGHRIAKAADKRDIARRMVAWFDKYLK